MRPPPYNGPRVPRAAMNENTKQILQRLVVRFVATAERVPPHVANALAGASTESRFALAGPDAIKGLHRLSADFTQNLQVISERFCARLADDIGTQVAVLLGTASWKTGVAADEITLMADSAMQREMLATRLGRQAEDALMPILASWRLGLTALLGSEISAARDPFRPQNVIDTLVKAFDDAPTAAQSRIGLLQTLELDLFGDLSPLYRDLLGQLESEGLGDQLRPRIVKSHDQAAGRPSAAGHARGSWSEVATSIQLAQAHFSAHAADETRTMAGGTDWMLSPSAAQPAAASDARAASPLDAIRRDVVEIVAEVFQAMFDATDIAAEAKASLGKLQAPIVLAAYDGPAFLDDAMNPPRRVLSRAVALAREAGTGAGAPDPAVASVLREVCDSVVQGYTTDPSCFADALSRLEALSSQAPAPEPGEFVAMATRLAKQEREEHAERIAAQAAIELITQYNAPPVLASFAMEHWRFALRDRILLSGESSPTVERMRKAFGLILWTAQPKHTGDERLRMNAVREKSLRNLESAFNFAGTGNPERAHITAELLRLQEEAMALPAGAEDTRFAKTQPQGPARAMEMPRHLTEVRGPDREERRRIVQGARLESAGPNPPRGRYRVEWVSPLRTRYILAGADGQAPLVIAFRALRDAMQAGLLQPLPADDLVEGALAAALSRRLSR